VDYKLGYGGWNNELGQKFNIVISFKFPVLLQIPSLATNLSGCINTASKNVDILLLFQNVNFLRTVMVNDLFMPGVDLEIFGPKRIVTL